MTIKLRATPLLKRITRYMSLWSEAYLEIFDGYTASVNAYLAYLAHIRSELEDRANHIKRLPADKLNEALKIIMKNSL